MRLLREVSTSRKGSEGRCDNVPSRIFALCAIIHSTVQKQLWDVRGRGECDLPARERLQTDTASTRVRSSNRLERVQYRMPPAGSPPSTRLGVSPISVIETGFGISRAASRPSWQRCHRKATLSNSSGDHSAIARLLWRPWWARIVGCRRDVICGCVSVPWEIKLREWRRERTAGN